MLKVLKSLLLTIFFGIQNCFDTVVGIFTTNSSFSDKPTIFLIGTPEHDNTGDHAIALSEIQFIQDYFPHYNIVEITVEHWRRYRINLLLHTKKEDMFFMTGGGNIGDIYKWDELVRRFIIKHFKENKIIVFPQTAYFSNSKKGQRELNKTVRLYNSHKKLLVCAREKQTYEFLKKYFCVQTYLCPDIVFRMRINLGNVSKGKNIGICVRNDNESSLSFDERKKLLKQLNDNYAVEYFNTCIYTAKIKQNRVAIITALLQKISSYQFVVTDRLHAMIFCVLTNVPCVVISPKSHKIISTLQWLKNKNVILISNIDNILQACNRLTSTENSFEFNQFENYYKELANAIKELL